MSTAAPTPPHRKHSRLHLRHRRAYRVKALLQHHGYLYPDGYARTKFELVFVDTNYTAFEMGFKGFFFAATLLVLLLPRRGFLWSLRNVPSRFWSAEQQWVLGLLCGLLVFDDPLFAARIYTDGALALTEMYAKQLYGTARRPDDRRVPAARRLLAS